MLAIRYDWEDTAVLALHNLSDAPVSVRRRARTPGTPGSSRLLDGDHRAARRGWHTIELDGFGSRWFRVGGLDDILRRRGW